MRFFTFKKSYFILISIFVSAFSIFSFQNCSQTKFQSVDMASEALSIVPESPVCDPAKRLLEFESIQCKSPNQSQLLARQFYNVICNENGQWTRVTKGPADYSQCPNSCAGTRPSDVENTFCPAPNNTVKNGVQRYTVTCLQEGSWSRTILGAVDYTACRGICNPATRPGSTSQVACPAPNSSLLSGVQNYTVTCNADGTWGRSILGGVDYSLCPQSCDPNSKPPSTANEKCPSSSDIKAVRNYNVICQSNGTWAKTPTTLDTSLCPSTTCDPNTRPGSQETIACPAPFTSSLLSKQNYSVSCSGTNWVRSPTTRDDSQCPKSCGTQPANDSTLVACQAPFQTSQQAKQNYTYTCNTTTGQYNRVASGAIDYTSCPKSCTGTNPAVRQIVACPAGTTGTAYQNFSSTCNTTTGQWTTPTPTTLDTSGCRAVTCTGTPPSNFDPVACPAPFQSRMDAKKMYSAATCVNGSWVRGTATGVIDTSSCPVNDCTGSVNPGTEKDIAACPGGATGRIYQTCSLSCTGNTYTQTNCSADNYSRCNCGANATFNVVTRTCVTTTPTYTYAWDPNAITYGSCSATACGTSGTKPGTYTTCRRNDGAIVAGSYCGSNVAPSAPCSAAACEVTCGAGTIKLNGSCQSCTASNASAWYLEANPDVKLAGLDALTHWCDFGKNEGRAGCFQASQCPKSCASGSIDVLSDANNAGTKTTCGFSWNSAKAGQNAVITRATNGGTLTGLCGATGDWTNVVSTCPKPADVGCTNGATNYPACNNRSCNAGMSVGGLKCQKICKGIDIGQRIIPGYLINTVGTGAITNQTNVTTGVGGTHFHPTVNHYAFTCNDGQLSWYGPHGWCEYHVDQLGVDAECDAVINAPVVNPCDNGGCGG
jgi:hypothetical protein